MPYFFWQGVALNGQLKKGKTFAQSRDDLDALLFKQDVALVHSTAVKGSRVLFKSVQGEHKILFFRQLSVLLTAGVLLPQALDIVTAQLHHQYFQQVAARIARDVSHGIPLSQALAKYPDIFSPLMIQMAYVGQESGALGAALALLADYLQAHQEFKQQLRSAALMPAITLAFFVAIALVIFMFVIPRFAALFVNFKQELPALTKGLIAVSGFLLSMQMVYVFFVFLFVLVGVKLLSRAQHYRQMLDAFYLCIPYVGTIIKNSNVACFLRSLAMLLEAGLPVVAAVRMAQHALTNTALAQYTVYVAQEIESGSSLSEALAQHPLQLFGPELLAMITVGQESGRLSKMVLYAAGQYNGRVKHALAQAVTLFQPLLMVFLGLLITLLIFAIYLPIFTLSQVIQ